MEGRTDTQITKVTLKYPATNVGRGTIRDFIGTVRLKKKQMPYVELRHEPFCLYCISD